MREALAGLPDCDRLLLKLTIVSGLSHEQLANIYSVNQSTITRWIARARAQVLEVTEREVCSEPGIAARRVPVAGGPACSADSTSVSPASSTPPARTRRVWEPCQGSQVGSLSM